MKTVLLLLLVAVVGCSDRNARQPEDPRIADASRPIVFLTHVTEPPFSYRDSSGNVAGVEIDLARRIAAKMERELVVEDVAFTDIIPRLKAGTADMGIATITITEERMSDVDFSEPYARGGACFLYRKDGKKPRMSQMSSLLVGVETDTLEDLYICRHGGDPLRFANLRDSLAALEKGKIDAIFFDIPQLKALADASNGRLAVTPQETVDWYGVAVDKRRPDVLAAANAVVREGGAK